MDERHEPDTDEALADGAAETSTEAWEDYSDRAEDDERRREGQPAADDAGMSPFPDVDLLADSMSNVGEVLTGDDEEERDPSGRRGAP